MTPRNRTLDVLMLTLALTWVPLYAPDAHAAMVGSLDYAQQSARGEVHRRTELRRIE
jgi:hypothetical protein